jgi:hypothetical protein
MKNDNKRVDKKLISRLVVPKTLTLFYGHENHGKMTKKEAKCRQAKRQANMHKSMKKIALTWWDLNTYL